ncbi:TPA: hypothetical protein TZS71_000660 [Streptococcus suis]|nr:hypothetical protein [Streptococcus suis]
MTNKGMMTLPIIEGNLMMAKAEALDDLIENGVISKETIINIGAENWYAEYLANKWGIEND